MARQFLSIQLEGKNEKNYMFFWKKKIIAMEKKCFMNFGMIIIFFFAIKKKGTCVMAWIKLSKWKNIVLIC